MACTCPKGDGSDPAFRRERASKAGKASQSVDSYVRRIVARAPELTDDQRAKLAAALRPEQGAAQR